VNNYLHAALLVTLLKRLVRHLKEVGLLFSKVNN